MTLLAEAKPALMREVFTSALDLVKDSRIQLLPEITTHPLNSAKEAFAPSRLGQDVLEVVADMSLMIQPPRPAPARLGHDASYLVVGGTGGIGRVIIRYLVRSGATRIITLSPSGADKAETRQLVEELSRQGVKLEAVKGTAADVDVLKSIAENSVAQPVRGVIHAGAVFEVGVISFRCYI